MRKTPVVLGVLSMVFGGLVAAWSLFGLISQSVIRDFAGSFSGAMLKMGPRRPGGPDPHAFTQAMTDLMQTLQPYTYLMGGSLLVLSLALAVVGFGQYRRQAWSRPASILWALVALAYIPFQLWIQVGVIMPKTQEVTAALFAGQKMAGMMDAMQGMQTGISIVTHVLFYALTR